MTERDGGAGMSEKSFKLPWRANELDGFSTEQGPTFDGGSFHGGGPRQHRTLTVRMHSPFYGQASVELDLTDGKTHGCTVTLNPDTARQAAQALLAAATQAEADLAHWREVLAKQRDQLAAANLRYLEAKAGGDTTGSNR